MNPNSKSLGHVYCFQTNNMLQTVLHEYQSIQQQNNLHLLLNILGQWGINL